MLSPVIIRKGKPQDAEKIAELMILAGDGLFETILGKKAHKVLTELVSMPHNYLSYDKSIVAEINNEVVGLVMIFSKSAYDKEKEFTEDFLMKSLGIRSFISLIIFHLLLPKNFGKPMENELYINCMAVSKKFQKRGIGKKLLNEVIDKFNRSSIPDISLDVVSTNENAISLYKSLGFELHDSKKPLFLSKKFANINRMIKKKKKNA
jgi:ribosomal protein S18 acetylase RimI-like enzyme